MTAQSYTPLVTPDKPSLTIVHSHAGRFNVLLDGELIGYAVEGGHLGAELWFWAEPVQHSYDSLEQASVAIERAWVQQQAEAAA